MNLARDSTAKSSTRRNPMQKVLKDEFGIEWKSPAELNQRIQYDWYGLPKITAEEERALRALTAERVSVDNEEIRLINRDFDGVANVWTVNHETHETHVYQFTGHDASWKFRGMAKVER